METETNLSTNLLRALALMQENGEEFFILEGKAFAGTMAEALEGVEGFEDDEDKPDLLVWCEENLTEVEELDPEDYNNDYLVLTDEEADEKAAEYIKNSLWAFNASFLSGETGIDQEVFEAIQANGKCESNNHAIESMIDDMDAFVEAAISADGRGHFMSSYDGNENEQTLSDDITNNGEQTFYIYRIN